MKLQTVFQRRVGAGTIKVLGTDVTPTGLPKQGTAAADNVMFAAHTAVEQGMPIERIAVMLHYAGVGPAPASVPVDAYMYVADTDSWYRIGTQIALVPDVVGHFDVVGGTLPATSASPTGDHADTLEVVLIPSAPVGAPAGTYTFGAVFDTSLDGTDSTAALVALLTLILGQLDVKLSTRDAEATQLKILRIMAGGTLPTNVADNAGVKVAAATPVINTTYSGAALNGAKMNGATGQLAAPHNVSVTTTAHAATYKTGLANAILVTGTEYYTGATVTVALALTLANGGETITDTTLFDAASISVFVPAQNDALGTFAFGTGTEAEGVQNAIVRGGAKGTTASATVTSTASGLNHQGLDVIRYDAAGNVAPAMDDPARPGIQRITDGSHYLPTADDKTRALYSVITDLTNVAAVLARTNGAESPACTLPALLTRGVESRTIIAPYSTRKGNGTSVWASDTTITFAGPAIVAGQILKVIASDGVNTPRKYESGLNAGFAVSGTGPYTITILGCGAHPITVADSIEVIWVAEDKGFVQSANGFTNLPAFSDRSFREPPSSLLAANQTITNAWADVGPELSCEGYNTLSVGWNYTKGDGTVTTLQVRALKKMASAATEEYPLPLFNVDTSATPYKATADDEIVYLSPVEATGLRWLDWDLKNTTPYVQLQVKATTPGTTMVLSKVEATKGW